MEQEFTQAVRTLVAELNRETASGLITRQALIALDKVQRLLDAGETAATPQAIMGSRLAAGAPPEAL